MVTIWFYKLYIQSVGVMQIKKNICINRKIKWTNEKGTFSFVLRNDEADSIWSIPQILCKMNRP